MKNGRTSGEILFDMDLFVNPSNGHSKGNFISSSGMIVEERRSSYEAETEGSCKQLPSRSVVRQEVTERCWLLASFVCNAGHRRLRQAS